MLFSPDSDIYLQAISYLMKKKRGQEKGSPIKGRVKRKNTSPIKKILHFFLLALSFSTARCCFGPVSHPLLQFYRFTVQAVLIRTSHPSGSRRLCFKRYTCTSSTMHKTRPFRLRRTRKSSVPYRVQMIYYKSYDGIKGRGCFFAFFATAYMICPTDAKKSSHRRTRCSAPHHLPGY